MYYEQATFSCDHYCAETWRTFGPVAVSLPELSWGIYSCGRGDCVGLAETAGAAGPDIVTWLQAEADWYTHVARNERPFYPYSNYPLGR